MNEKDYDKLLKTAGAKLGTSPEKLRQTLESGDMASLSGGLSAADKARLKAVLGNKELMAKLKSASSPQEVMKLLSGK